MKYYVACMCCGASYTPSWTWYICDNCNFRICTSCLTKHKGKYAPSGGFKCSQCYIGWLKLQRL